MQADDRADQHRDRGSREGVLAGFIMILSSSYVGSVLGLLRGVLVARIIGPTGRGLVQLVNLANMYLTHSHLGALHGLSKELPLALGAGKHQRATELENTAGVLVLSLGSLASAGLFAYAWLRPDLGAYTRETVALGAAIILCGQAYGLYRVVLRSWGQFKVLAVSAVITTLGMLLFMYTGAYVFAQAYGQAVPGAVGATWGWLLASLGVLYYLHCAVGFRVTLDVNWQVARRLILVGLPIAVVLLSDILLRTVDGFIILKVWKVTRFGVYSVAMQIATHLYRLPEAMGFVLMPHIWERYGATSDITALHRHVVSPTLVAAAVMPAIAGAVHIFVPAFVYSFIPDFSDCIVPAQLLALASVFLALPVAANGLLIALNREFIVAAYKALGAALVATGTLLAVYYAGYGQLRWVATSAGLGYFVASLFSLFIVFRRYHKHRLALWSELSGLHIPILWAVLCLYCAGLISNLLGINTLGEWLQGIFKLPVFLLLYAPVLWYANSRTEAFGKLTRLLIPWTGRHKGPGAEHDTR